MPIRPHYLDASAAIKLLTDEKEGDRLRAYFNSNSGFFMTSVCLAETLGVLKVKWCYRSELSQPKYLHLCRLLLGYVAEGRIQVYEPELHNNVIVASTKSLAEKYSLDFSDAFQLVTLREKFRGLAAESRAVLITADGPLASAARAEGIKVWNCRTETEPPT